MDLHLKSLLRRYVAERGGDSPVSWPLVAVWMCERVQGCVSASTWAVYRCALLKGVEDEGVRIRVKGIFKANKLNERRKRRVIKRKKGMTSEEEQALIGELLSYRRKTYGKVSAMWWKAAVAVGSRPSEWIGAAILTLDGIECVRLVNAKRIQYEDRTLLETVEKQGRVSSIYRTIPISHLPEKTKEIIRAQVAFMEGVNQRGIFDDTYSSVRKTIRAAGDYLWPGNKKVPSLYTARHIYRDRVRVMLAEEGLNRGQIDIVTAVLMGHGSTKSQYAYGVDDDYIATGSESLSLDALSPQIKVLLKQAMTSYE